MAKDLQDSMVYAAAGDKSLRKRALRASAWVVGAKPLGMALQLLRSMILTRLLFPEAFGLMALVSVVMQGLQMCSDMGVGPSVIKSKRGTEERFLQTAWTVQVVRGVILWLACCALAWPAAIFYHQPELSALLPLAGLSVVIGGFHTSAWSVHGREMKQGRLVLIDTLSQSLNLVVMVLVAWWLRNVWALVFGGISASILYLVLGFIWLPGIRHRFCWDREAVRELVHFGKWVFISTVLTFFAMQLDRLMLGRLIPIGMLGVYSISLVLANVPRDLIQNIAAVVLFPVLAEKFRQEPERRHDPVQRARGMTLRLGLLLCLGVMVAAPLFFQLLYDARYAAAGWIAQLLALSAWVTVMNATSGYTLLALGDSRAVAEGNLANVVVTIGGASLGFWLLGLPGFIGGYALGTAAGELVQVVKIRRHGVSLLRQDVEFTLWAIGGGLAYAGITLGIHTASPVRDTLVDAALGMVIWCGVAGCLLPPVVRQLTPKWRLRRPKKTSSLYYTGVGVTGPGED